MSTITLGYVKLYAARIGVTVEHCNDESHPLTLSTQSWSYTPFDLRDALTWLRGYEMGLEETPKEATNGQNNR